MPKSKASYVDGFVIVIPKKNIPAYRRMAAEAGKVWRKYGALDYKESVGEDLNPHEHAQMWSFPQMTKLKRNETVAFSYIVFKSRKHRDQVNAKVMKDPIIAKYENLPMPFDMKKMAYGGFKIIVDA